MTGTTHPNFSAGDTYSTNFASRAPSNVGLRDQPQCNWKHPVTPGRPFDWFALHMVKTLVWIGGVLDPLKIAWWAQGHSGTFLGMPDGGARQPGTLYVSDKVAMIGIRAKP